MNEPTVIVTAGAAFFGLAALLWALRVSDGARGAAKRYRDRTDELEDKLTRAESVFSANPGVILVWDVNDDPRAQSDSEEWGNPRLYGSQHALASLLRYTDDSNASSPAARLLEGVADLEARDAIGTDTTLRRRLKELREQGMPFSLTMSGPSGSFMEADGRTAGARAVVWLADTTLKGLEGSSARGRLEETRRTVARDPMAFLELLSRAPFPAWRMSGGGRLQWANTAYQEAVECRSLDQALEKQALLNPRIEAQNKRTIEQGSETLETHTLSLKGEIRTFRIHVFPISGGTGGVAIDVTNEEQIHLDRDRLVKANAETLNQVADAIAVFDTDRKLSFYNLAFIDLWKLEPGFLADRPTYGEVLDRLHVSRLLPTQADYARWRAEQTAPPPDVLTRVEEHWPMPSGRLLKQTRQRHALGGMLVLFRDVTVEHKVQAQFNQSMKVQIATINALQQAVAVFSRDARLSLSNKAFSQMWELPDSLTVPGTEYNDIVERCTILTGTQGETWSEIKYSVTGVDENIRSSRQGEMLLTDQRRIIFKTEALPDGATMIAFLDHTDTHKLQHALRQSAEAYATADRLKSEFISNVSRQLRDPLNAMLGYAEFLEHGLAGELTPGQQDKIGSILAGGNELKDRVDNILELAMIDAGEFKLEFEEVDIADAVERAVSGVVSSLADTEVQIKRQIAGNIGLIRADGQRVRQMIANLLANALHTTPKGGTISIKAERLESFVELTVSDTGGGFDYDHQANAFEPFGPVDRRGVALSLSIVRKYAELHKGAVRYRSVPGEGTTVTVQLHCDPEPNFDELLGDALPAPRAAA